MTGIEKVLYDEMFNSENTSVGVRIISCVACASRKICASSYVTFRAELPVLINFILGIWVVKMNPGFIERISVEVSFVSFFISNVSDIVVDCRVLASLYKMFGIWIVKFPSRVA